MIEFERGELALLFVYFKDDDGTGFQPTNDSVYAYIYAGETLYEWGQASYLGTLGFFEYRWEIPMTVPRGVWHVDFQAAYQGEEVPKRNLFKVKHSGLD
jgi:hypothetical protein